LWLRCKAEGSGQTTGVLSYVEDWTKPTTPQMTARPAQNEQKYDKKTQSKAKKELKI
jgi:hypothetical protein